MEIKEVCPNGGTNKMWEPMHLEVTGLNLPGITIQGRTWTRDGAEIFIFYNGEQMSNHNYDYHRILCYQNKMARDASEDVNLIFEICGISAETSIDDLLPIMNTVRNKCESRYGNRLPDSEYEILVIFN